MSYVISEEQIKISGG